MLSEILQGLKNMYIAVKKKINFTKFDGKIIIFLSAAVSKQ